MANATECISGSIWLRFEILEILLRVLRFQILCALPCFLLYLRCFVLRWSFSILPNVEFIAKLDSLNEYMHDKFKQSHSIELYTSVIEHLTTNFKTKALWNAISPDHPNARDKPNLGVSWIGIISFSGVHRNRPPFFDLVLATSRLQGLLSSQGQQGSSILTIQENWKLVP